jgi:hypothetical protein
MPVRIFSYSLFNPREYVIPDAKTVCSRRSSSSNRSNPPDLVRGPFKTSKAGARSKFKVQMRR